MAKFESKDGTVTRITGRQVPNARRKLGSYVEAQLFGGKVMLTANQGGTADTANVEMSNEEARMFAAAILNLADVSEARGETSIASSIAEVFTSNLAAFDEVDTAHTRWLDS
jgi:hypothetical protein